MQLRYILFKGAFFAALTGGLMLGSTGSIVAPALAQSLDPNKPAPLKAGINSATADSTVGTQYWYYMAQPGPHTLTVTFQSMGVLGAPMRNSLAVTLSSELGSERKLVTSEKAPQSVSFSGTMVKPTKMTVRIDPLSPTGLVRQGGDYQVQVTGNVRLDGGGTNVASGSSAGGAFASAGSNGAEKDPVIRAYMAMLNDWGITKFLPDGTVSAADGTVGSWKLEDADTQSYTVKLGHDHLSLVLMAGRGLVSADSKDILIFKQMR